MAAREDAVRDLRDAAEHVHQLKGRTYRSPDDALADLLAAQMRVNEALARAATTPTGSWAAKQMDIPDALRQIVGELIERAREVAKQFGAVGVAIQVSGFPPSVSISLSWSS